MSETKYVVKFTTQFKKDFKLAMKRGFKMDLLEDVITLLAMGEVLPDKNKELHGFPPVGCWEKLKQVFAGDGLAAEETSGKLVLSW